MHRSVQKYNFQITLVHSFSPIPVDDAGVVTTLVNMRDVAAAGVVRPAKIVVRNGGRNPHEAGTGVLAMTRPRQPPFRSSTTPSYSRHSYLDCVAYRWLVRKIFEDRAASRRLVSRMGCLTSSIRLGISCFASVDWYNTSFARMGAG